MSAEVGQFALILALLLAIVQCVTPFWGATRGDPVLMALGRSAAVLQGAHGIEHMRGHGYARMVKSPICLFKRSIAVPCRYHHTIRLYQLNYFGAAYFRRQRYHGYHAFASLQQLAG